MVNTPAKVCALCKHRVHPNRPDPFRHTTRWSPEMIERRSRWEADQRRRREREDALAAAGEAFDFEPRYYDWCRAWTEAIGARSVDMIHGTSRPLHQLCLYHNREGNCPRFAARDTQEDT